MDEKARNTSASAKAQVPEQTVFRRIRFERTAREFDPHEQAKGVRPY
jgi:hypothetical protein